MTCVDTAHFAWHKIQCIYKKPGSSPEYLPNVHERRGNWRISNISRGKKIKIVYDWMMKQEGNFREHWGQVSLMAIYVLCGLTTVWIPLQPKVCKIYLSKCLFFWAGIFFFKSECWILFKIPWLFQANSDNRNRYDGAKVGTQQNQFDNVAKLEKLVKLFLFGGFGGPEKDHGVVLLGVSVSGTDKDG